MVAIDPDNVRSAAAHLRVTATIAGGLELDLRRASLLSGLDTSAELAACAEIEEELDMLAAILVARADEAAGFYLPGSGWRTISTLLGSLLDDQGATAAMSAPLALSVLMEQATASAVDGSNPTTTNEPFDQLVFTIAGLQAIAADSHSSPELAAAAAFLADNPHLVETTRAWEGTGAHLPSHAVGEIPLRDIAAFLDRNEMLRQLVGPNGIVAPDDIYGELDDAALLAVGIDPERFNALAMPANGHDLLVAAINHGTFDHSPLLARDFIQTLPVHYLDGQSIDIRTTDSAALERLYDAATIDLGSTPGDFIVRSVLTAFLPETTTAIRNQLITSSYAESAQWHNVALNGTRSATDLTYAGNNWFHLGVSASDSVGPVIRGEQQVFARSLFPGFDTPAAVDQDVADGNQAIYHHFITAQAGWWQHGSTGSPRLDAAFALLEEAAETEDPVEAQYLVAESTVLFSIEEQIIVDNYLQLDGLSPLDEGGAFLITTLGLNPRTASQVMTDDGLLRVQADGEDLLPPLSIGDPVPRPTQENNYIDPEILSSRLPDDFDWNRTTADNWSSLGQRMPVIEDVAILLLTEPALPAMVEHHRRGHLDMPR